MKEIDMPYTFIKCAKRFISDIDEEELDWQLRTHQCYFDDSGPCCSDATLLEVFREATFNKVDESELYAVIEKICMCYCDEIKSARSLTSIIIPEGTTAIEPYAFRGFAALASITIPKSVTTIGDWAFSECGSLKYVYCKATTPPALDGSYVFYNSSGRRIIVPIGSGEAYKTAKYWSGYADSIFEDEF